MKKILISLLTVALVGGGVYGATSAFFSDTETSNNNTITAGSVDLQVSSTYNGPLNANGSSPMGDLLTDGSSVLFNFVDVKPGDLLTGTIAIKATTNDYWACMSTDVTASDEHDVTNPELTVNSSDIGPVGELHKYLKFVFWNDVNPNGVYDPGDANLSAAPLNMAQLENLGNFPLADSVTNGPAYFQETPLTSGATYTLGYKVCFGDFTGPDYTGCDGNISAPQHNEAQTDSLTASITLSAIQSRNNDNYVCDENLDEANWPNYVSTNEFQTLVDPVLPPL